MAGKAISHEEVWDDSALVRSWNEAYQEYLKYHSLAAKGEKIKIAEPAAKDALPNGNAPEPERTAIQPDAIDAEPSADIDPEDENLIEEPAEEIKKPTAKSKSKAAAASIPQVLLASAQNEEMKNLMMSWYYAGYYTGLYEGKQMGYASAKEESTGG